MLTMSLGTIEVYGLPAAVLAADVACKAANVRLIGYEKTEGMGMVTVKIEGQVAAVQAAIAAAAHAVSDLTSVFATSVIPRPNEQLGAVVLTPETVGLDKSAPEPAEAATAPEATDDSPAPAEDESAEPQPAAPKTTTTRSRATKKS